MPWHRPARRLSADVVNWPLHLLAALDLFLQLQASCLRIRLDALFLYDLKLPLPLRTVHSCRLLSPCRAVWGAPPLL